MKKLNINFILTGFILFANFNARANDFIQDTTDVTVLDTTLLDTDTECSSKFFANLEKPVSDDKVTLITKNKKRVSLASFLNDNINLSIAEYGFADLDHDGKKELLITNFTGGAHCCDEVYFFRNISPNTYQYVTVAYGGSVCVMKENEFIFNFYEHFGYFFTCFACAYTDTAQTAPIPVEWVTLKYKNGKLSVIPGDQELKSLLVDNLEILSEQPYEKLESPGDQDNGLRKAFALNLVVYYYSFGKNTVVIRQLFDKYYKFPDARIVWTEFLRNLRSMQTKNNF